MLDIAPPIKKGAKRVGTRLGAEAKRARIEGGWVAEYDYTAIEADEASVREGDLVVDVEVLDKHWVKGTVIRTGLTGTVPLSYLVRPEARGSGGTKKRRARKPKLDVGDGAEGQF